MAAAGFFSESLWFLTLYLTLYNCKRIVLRDTLLSIHTNKNVKTIPRQMKYIGGGDMVSIVLNIFRGVLVLQIILVGLGN